MPFPKGHKPERIQHTCGRMISVLGWSRHVKYCKGTAGALRFQHRCSICGETATPIYTDRCWRHLARSKELLELDARLVALGELPRNHEWMGEVAE